MAFAAELREFALEAMNRLSVPGVSIGVTTPEGREVVALGVTALDTQFAVRGDTVFQVGSVSKPFTATLVMALVEDGKLDLDEPVVTYVPNFRLGSRDAAQRITLRHLLSHQGGFWGDWFEDFGLGDDATERFCDEYWRLPQLYAPGDMWAYNNCGYILAGYTASRAAGKNFDAAIKEFILDPLTMDHTFLSAADAIAYPVAVGHTNSGEDGAARVARQFLRPRARNPAGGVLASVEDILTFADLHLGRRSEVLSSSSIAAMREPLVSTFETGAAWGLGFKIQEASGGALVGHGGATNGFRAQLEMAPDSGFGVAVLTNSDSGSRLSTEVVDWVLERRLGIRPLEKPTHDLAGNESARYAGTYRQPYASIEVDQRNGALSGRLTTHSPYSENSEPQTGDWFGLQFIGDDRFVVAGGELKDSQIKFWTQEDGSIRFLQAGGRLYVPGSWDELEGAAAA